MGLSEASGALRLIFLGTPEFAVPTLEALLEAAQTKGLWEVTAVFTQPDRKVGRGQRSRASPVKQTAVAWGIPVFQPERIRGNREAVGALRKLRPDLMVVAAFGQILPAELFEYPRHGTLNVHASLLPAYRGAAPVVHALLNGEGVTGVTIMKIDEGMDTGDCLTQVEVPIDADMTAGELEAALACRGAKLLVETVLPYVDGALQLRSQNSDFASYAPRIEKEDARLTWDQPAPSIHNRIRAFNPRPGAFTTWRNEQLKVWRSRHTSMTSDAELGQVVALLEEEVVVSCQGGTCLGLVELQLPSRKRVSAREFINGCHLRVGERLGDDFSSCDRPLPQQANLRRKG